MWILFAFFLGDIRIGAMATWNWCTKEVRTRSNGRNGCSEPSQVGFRTVRTNGSPKTEFSFKTAGFPPSRGELRQPRVRRDGPPCSTARPPPSSIVLQGSGKAAGRRGGKHFSGGGLAPPGVAVSVTFVIDTLLAAMTGHQLGEFQIVPRHQNHGVSGNQMADAVEDVLAHHHVGLYAVPPTPGR